MTRSSVNATLLSNARAERYHSRNLVTEREGGGVCHPQEQTKILSVCYGEKRRYELPQSGYPKVNQDLSVCFWGSGDVSRPNDDEVIGQCDLIVERASRAISFAQSRYRTRGRRGLSPPRANQDFICLLWGEAEVRVAPIWVPKSKPRFICLLLGERRHHTFRSCPLWAKKSPSILYGYPKANQDNVCLLLGKRRYELLSMIEQSDIIRANSLPNATAEKSVNSKFKILNYLPLRICIFCLLRTSALALFLRAFTAQ